MISACICAGSPPVEKRPGGGCRVVDMVVVGGGGPNFGKSSSVIHVNVGIGGRAAGGIGGSGGGSGGGNSTASSGVLASATWDKDIPDMPHSHLHDLPWQSHWPLR